VPVSVDLPDDAQPAPVGLAPTDGLASRHTLAASGQLVIIGLAEGDNGNQRALGHLGEGRLSSEITAGRANTSHKRLFPVFPRCRPLIYIFFDRPQLTI